MRVPQGSDPVAERAAVSPQQVAIVRAADGERWPYERLDDAVDRTAGRLAALGVAPGDHVGLLAETDLPAVRTVFAALRIGAVPVPLNARLTAGELGPQLAVADVDVLVCAGATEGLAVAAAKQSDGGSAIEAGVTTIATIDGQAEDDAPIRLAEQSTSEFTAPTPAPDDRRLLLFTSGTTGTPKAVELTAGNLRSSAIASAFRLGVAPDDRWFVPLAIYHMGGFAPVYRSVLYGTTAVLQREFDAERTLAAIAAHEATCLSVVPTMLRRLLDVAGSSEGAADDAPSAPGPLTELRFVLSGGAATPASLVERCADLDVPLCPTYGITETGSQVATALPEEAREQPGTVGRPLFPTTVRIVEEDVEAEAGARYEPLPAGEPGEIVVDGPTVSPGYYGDEAATAASRSELGYHTGDLGCRDEDGRLWVLGRADAAISTGGELVHPAEVADALKAHPAIAAAAVVGLDDPEWGERVAALLVPADDEVGIGALQAHSEDQLAGYKRPKTIGFARELPRTASGTVDREAVREILREDGIDA